MQYENAVRLYKIARRPAGLSAPNLRCLGRKSALATKIPARQSRNRNSECLPQRRKGRKLSEIEGENHL